MKDAAIRDAMVARVKSAFGKYPTFDAVPVVKAAKGDILVKLDGNDEQAYVSALHKVCARHDLAGRTQDSLVAKVGR